MEMNNIKKIVKQAAKWKPIGAVTLFKNISIGSLFLHNGATYVKKSSRTAYNVEFERIFYFSKDDAIII